MNEEKIKEVFSDEEFVKSLFALETPEEVQAALAEKDVDFSVDEIKTIYELLKKKADGTLTDEELQAVAGGSVGMLVCLGLSAVMFITTIYAVAHEAVHNRW